ncbi:anti-sigma factor family protein [Candidatus Latescibacterota bacterium]
MKIANENYFTCSQFKMNLRAFIDNELPVNNKTLFLEHASKCPDCNTALKEMQSLKKMLFNLKRYSVTPEFDFRLKSSLRLAHERKYFSWNSLRFINYDNMSKLLAVSACAAAIVLGIMFINKGGNNQVTPGLPDIVETHVDSYNGVELIPDSNGFSIEEINFVLETIKPSDVEKGIFQENPDGSLSIPENMTLISY